MANISPRVAYTINQFLSWFEDNMGEETWLDSEDYTDGPDGTWKSYLELPEYLAVIKAVKEQKKK